MPRKIITLILVFFLSGKITFGIELSEISFDEANGDWIEIRISEEKATNFSHFKIYDDSLISEFYREELPNTNFILIHLGSEKDFREKTGEIYHIFTTKKGLTKTSEQVYLTGDESIIDAICWNNSSPPKSETNDLNKLKELFLVPDCINSEMIKKSQSIAKIQKKWEIFTHPTPGKENTKHNTPPKAKITIQKGELKNTIPFSLNLDGSESHDPDNDKITYHWEYPDTTFEKANPNSYKFEKEGTYKISLTVEDESGEKNTTSITVNALPKTISPKTSKTSTSKPMQPNGDQSTEITINEIFPNPKGKDNNLEWIELYNHSNKNINLSNWQIESSKTTTLPQITINAKSYLILEQSILKQSLKNTENTISLKDYNKNIIDQISYPSAPENKSYAKIKLQQNTKEKHSYMWVAPTKNKQNPTLWIIKGTITSPPIIGEEFSLEVLEEINKGTLTKIFFKLEDFEFETIKTLLPIDAQVSLLTQKENNQYILKDFHIEKTAPYKSPMSSKKTNWALYALIPTAALIGGLFYVNRKTTTGHYPS